MQRSTSNDPVGSPASEARLVVLGDSEVLAQLSLGQSSVEWSVATANDYTEAEPTDRAECEVWKRKTDELYNGLRRKMIVRLVVVRLHESDAAIRKASDEWRMLTSRLREVNEERVEGMSFATILIVAEGELLASHQSSLQELMESPQAAHKWQHRVYLMTRKLELGNTEVLHSEFVWPVLVRGLLRHLAWKRGAAQRESTTVSGFYAWRFVEFAFDIPEPSVRENAVNLQRSIQKRLTAEVAGQPGGSAVSVSPSVIVIDQGMDPAEPTGDGKFWWENPAEVRRFHWHPGTAEIATYAAGVRSDVFSKAATDATDLANGSESEHGSRMADDLRTIKQVLDSLSKCPFPAPMAFPRMEERSHQDATLVLQGLAPLDAEVRRTERLRDESLEELELARLHFVGTKDRLIIGAVLASALTFFSFGAVLLLHSVFEFLPVWRHAWGVKAGGAAAAAVCGVATCILAGRWLQDYRGRKAGERAKQRAIEAQKAKAARVRQSCNLVRTAEPVRPWLWRVNLREAMQNRFQRIHEIVSREWIPSEDAVEMKQDLAVVHVDGGESVNRARQIAIADKATRIILSSRAPQFEPQKLERLESQKVGQFRAAWADLLGSWDPHGRVFLPAAPLRKFFGRFRFALHEAIRKGLSDQIRERRGIDQEDAGTAEGAKELAGNFMNFASVDLQEGSRFDSYLYASEPMMGALNKVIPQGAQETVIDDTKMPPRIVGIFFSEAVLKLRKNPKDPKASLSFTTS